MVYLLDGNRFEGLESVVERDLEIDFSLLHHALFDVHFEALERLLFHASVHALLLQQDVVLLVAEVLQTEAVFGVQILIGLTNEVDTLFILPIVLEGRIEDEVERLLLNEVVSKVEFGPLERIVCYLDIVKLVKLLLFQ